MDATPDTADYEQIRAGLPVASPDAHDLDSPELEVAFAQLAIDHPEAVTPGLDTDAPAEPGLKTPARARRRIATLLDRLVDQTIAEVRITPARVGTRTLMCVMLLSPARTEIPVPHGGSAKISKALRTALPKADWTVAQNYNPATGELTRHLFAIPACLQGGAR
ncbi:hypothetical protein HHL19_16190 [Streptomyces sp. R302]|uniref:hypothetical protein n=1 Tax=unclassified Streptomyces TaxID=2593676 RepID=UPI00145E0061|nr:MULTISPECIES: hypothetical protein [unclassified Streptomyces]NML55313.1 hypothetical protein [Streptomyces sp. R301]NML80185.1 hypothetical protein [Streptomyces sp. R302]